MATTDVKLETKLKQLRITVDRTNNIVETKRQEAIERHIKTIKSVTQSINEIRVTVEEEKIQSNVDEAEITALNNNIDKKLEHADIAVEELKAWLDKCRKENDDIAREEQIQFETKLFETRKKYEAELASVRVETLNPIPQMAKGESEECVRAKLPKLVISKFNGDFQDWQRFWGQFT